MCAPSCKLINPLKNWAIHFCRDSKPSKFGLHDGERHPETDLGFWSWERVVGSLATFKWGLGHKSLKDFMGFLNL